MNSLWLIFCGILIFCVGYWRGRFDGNKEGYIRGFKEAPLELKRRSLELGECLICGITKNFQDYAGKH
jgi:hypothetical protein